MNIYNGTNGNDNWDNITDANSNDTFNGNAGFDTVNYSSLIQSITFSISSVNGLVRTKIFKGTSGIDTITGVERIVGDPNQINTIDASGAFDSTRLYINLATNYMRLDNIPNLITRNVQPSFSINPSLSGVTGPSRFLGITSDNPRASNFYSLAFTVENFRNVTGTPNDAPIQG
jgi:hypothetical protein